VALGEQAALLQDRAQTYPHELFLVNKRGQTPLDIIIEEEMQGLEEQSSEPHLLERQPTTDLEQHKSGLPENRPKSVKVMDESQMRQLIDQSHLEDPEKGVVQGSKYRDLLGKCRVLIKSMNQHHPLSSIRFIMEPHHLDRRFLRSFSMAVKQNKTSVVHLFPKRSVKTRYVCLT
jgi:hypothetical protein